MSSKRRRTDSDASDMVPVAVPSDENRRNSPDNDNVPSAVAPPPDRIRKLLREGMRKDTSDGVDRALEELTNLVDPDANLNWKENRQRAYSMGGHSYVVEAMDKWRENENIQQLACYFLADIAIFNHEVDDFNNSEYVIGIWRSGGLEAAMNAMEFHRDTPDVNLNALCLFCNLLYHAGKDVSPIVDDIARRFVNELGGIQKVVRIMKTFPDDVYIQHNACRLLKYLVIMKAEIRNQLKIATGLVGEALSKHGDNDEKLKQLARTFIIKMYPLKKSSLK